jgi:hypothetical protein
MVMVMVFFCGASPCSQAVFLFEEGCQMSAGGETDDRMEKLNFSDRRANPDDYGGVLFNRVKRMIGLLPQESSTARPVRPAQGNAGRCRERVPRRGMNRGFNRRRGSRLAWCPPYSPIAVANLALPCIVVDLSSLMAGQPDAALQTARLACGLGEIALVPASICRNETGDFDAGWLA